jgi:hypothetical protein
VTYNAIKHNAIHSLMNLLINAIHHRGIGSWVWLGVKGSTPDKLTPHPFSIAAIDHTTDEIKLLVKVKYLLTYYIIAQGQTIHSRALKFVSSDCGLPQHLSVCLSVFCVGFGVSMYDIMCTAHHATYITSPYCVHCAVPYRIIGRRSWQLDGSPRQHCESPWVAHAFVK